MKFVLITLLVILLSSCCRKTDNRLFYVIKPIELSKEDSSGYIDEPLFYSYDNFILYNDSTIYYHKINLWVCGRCGTGLDHSKPPFLDLQPSGLREIPFDQLDSFWKTHIKKSNKHVTISSPTDTIYNPAILKLKQLSGYSSNILLNIRKCTEEQLFVSKAKFLHTDYSAKQMNWEIGFDDSDIPPIREKLRFIPPAN